MALAVSLLAVALLFCEALFLGGSTLPFPLDDPRAGARPWARAAAPGELLPDVNLATPDLVGIVLPGLIRSQALVASGGSGAWDDAQLLGFPFAANQHSPRPSHIAWLAAPFEPQQALDLLLAGHVAAALWLAYRAARLFGAAPAFAALAAVGFAFNSWMTARWHCAPMSWASTWFPLQLAALAWLRSGQTVRAGFEFGLGTALGLLSGFPQAALLLSGAAVLLGLLDGQVRRTRTLATLGCAGLAGLALALPALLGSFLLESDSLRARPESRAALAASHVPVPALAGLILPDAFGDPVAFGSEQPPAATMEEWLPQRRWLAGQLQGNVAEVACYVGLLVLMLLPAALGGKSGRDARRLALVALLALAGAVFAARLLTAVPGLERLAFSNSKRLLCVWCCVVPFAAALGAQAVAERRVRWPLFTTASVLLALLLAPLAARSLEDAQAQAFAAALAEDLPRQVLLLAAAAGALAMLRRRTASARTAAAFAWLPALVLAGDLVGQARHFNPTVPHEPFLRPTRTISALLEHAASSTHAPSEAPADGALRAEGAAPHGRVAVFGAEPNLLTPTLASAAGLRMLHGVTAMVPARTADLLACIEGPLFDPQDPRVGRGFLQPSSLTHPLLDLLGVTVVAHASPALAAESGLPVLLEIPEEGLGLLSRPDAWPFAFVVGGVRVLTEPKARVEWLARRDSPLRETVLVEQPVPFALPERGDWSAASVLRPGPETIHVRFDAQFPGVLVVAEAWDPGWSVWIDGEPAEPIIANHALLGVFVAAGPHAVEWRYAIPGASAAALAAWAGGLLLAAAGLLTLRPRSQPIRVPSAP